MNWKSESLARSWNRNTIYIYLYIYIYIYIYSCFQCLQVIHGITFKIYTLPVISYYMFIELCNEMVYICCQINASSLT
jgi:hypothetical protein